MCVCVCARGSWPATWKVRITASCIHFDPWKVKGGLWWEWVFFLLTCLAELRSFVVDLVQKKGSSQEQRCPAPDYSFVANSHLLSLWLVIKIEPLRTTLGKLPHQVQKSQFWPAGGSHYSPWKARIAYANESPQLTSNIVFQQVMQNSFKNKHCKFANVRMWVRWGSHDCKTWGWIPQVCQTK